MLNLFDKRGALRTDFTDAETVEIAALDPQRRLALDKLIAPAKSNEAVEAALKNSEADLKKVALNQFAAAREFERVTPKLTHHDLYLATVKKIPPAPPTPEQIAAEAAVAATTEQLAIGRDALDAARQSVKTGRASFADALSNWQNDGQPIPTQNELVRQMAKSFKPTPVPQRQAASLLDAVAASSAGPIDARQRGQHFRRGAGGQRSYPQGMRGQTVKV